MDLYSESLPLDTCFEEDKTQVEGDLFILNTESEISNEQKNTVAITDNVYNSIDYKVEQETTLFNSEENNILTGSEINTEVVLGEEKASLSTKLEDIAQTSGKKYKKRKIQAPSRESKRKKVSPKKISYTADTLSNSRCVWTNDDKKKLIKGLQEFGVDNIKGLQLNLPNKNASSIKTLIKKWQELGRNKLEKHVFGTKRVLKGITYDSVQKLDEWIEHFKKLHDISPHKLFTLANVFLLISEYGKFPDPSKCGGIDFRAMYRYLHCMLNGKPYFGMNQVTADVVRNCVQNLEFNLRSNSRNKFMTGFLSMVSDNPVLIPFNTYYRIPAKNLCIPEPAPKGEANNFLSDLDYNPLKIPSNLLEKPIKIKEEESWDTNTIISNENNTLIV